MLSFLHSSLAHQPGDEGIAWTTGLTWQQVKEKARKENKYIFLDCYATWCGPCKEMDKTVYTNDTVGDFFNERFISVKVQMDKTKKDEAEIRQWYADADKIKEQYHVLSLPTYLFMAPDGRIVHKDVGYKNAGNFLTTASIAVEPGRVYTDKYAEFDKLEADYHAGIKHYDRMPYMIGAALELGKTDLAKQWNKEYLEHLGGLSKKQLYSKTYIEYLGTVSLKSSSNLFKLFYPNGKKADKVMGVKGYSDHIVDKTVFREVTAPFLNIKGLSRMLGGKTDTAEADWPGLYDKIAATFSPKYAQRGVLEAKIIWYEQHFNRPLLYKAYLEKLDKYGFDTVSAQSNTNYSRVNFYCWSLFQSIDDKELLSRAAKHMEAVVRAKPADYACIDTYANLRYKAGEKEKAIYWEEKALELAKERQITRYINLYTSVLAKMRAGEPTWPVKRQ